MVGLLQLNANFLSLLVCMHQQNVKSHRSPQKHRLSKKLMPFLKWSSFYKAALVASLLKCCCWSSACTYDKQMH